MHQQEFRNVRPLTAIGFGTSRRIDDTRCQMNKLPARKFDGVPSMTTPTLPQFP
jgi:hypothetical protein